MLPFETEHNSIQIVMCLIDLDSTNDAEYHRTATTECKYYPGATDDFDETKDGTQNTADHSSNTGDDSNRLG